MRLAGARVLGLGRGWGARGLGQGARLRAATVTHLRPATVTDSRER